MERAWYARLAVALIVIIAAWIVVWPSIHRFFPSFPIPAWLNDRVPNHITPGLDIQGGLRMMYTVDMDAATLSLRNAKEEQLRRTLADKMGVYDLDEQPTDAQLAAFARKVTFPSPRRPGEIRLQFTDAADVRHLDRDMVRNLGGMREVSRAGREVVLEISEERVTELRELAVEQAKETIKQRITEAGIGEANVRAQDIDIIVEIPGADEADFGRIREIISQTAHLQFMITDDRAPVWTNLDGLPEGIRQTRDLQPFLMVDGPGPCPEGVEPDAPDGQCKGRTRLEHFIETLQREQRIQPGRVLAIGRVDVDIDETDDQDDESAQEEPDQWRTWGLFAQPPNAEPVGGEHLSEASVGQGQQSEPVVNFQMNPDGARRMGQLTSQNLQKRMAIVLDGVVTSAPTIQSTITARGQITLGGFRDFNTINDEARDLVIVLRSGALAAPIEPQNEQLIGPTLGRDSVLAGAKGAVIGIILVLLFMGIYYEVAGIVANIMVLLNVFFVFALMAFFNSDLTLPGIAGIALTVGMAVDANVLITERIREELRMGKSPRAATDQGYRRAFSAILDGHITTVIAGVVLLQFGSAELQGFAKTLLYGIIASLYTSVFMSKIAMDWIVKGLKVARLRVG
jgi:preprotein translocase subunit SecD